MTGLRIVQVVSMPGDIGWPTQLPTEARSSGWTLFGHSSYAPVVKSPLAHWPRRKNCVRVRPMNLSWSSFVTEFDPELSGINGTQLWKSRWCGAESSEPDESRK